MSRAGNGGAPEGLRGVIPLAEARRRLQGALPLRAASLQGQGGQPPVLEIVPTGPACTGRVLAQEARAVRDMPSADRSLVDGWAVPAGNGLRLRPAGRVGVGTAPGAALQPGTAVYVATGALLPPGTVAVVMQEEVRLQGGELVLRRPPRAGENVVRQGADARAGAALVPPGRRLRPAEVAWLAAAGLARVTVYGRPRVGVLVTGDEVQPLGGVAGEAPVERVWDANGPGLAAALGRDGCLPVPLGVLPDEPTALRTAVTRGLELDALLCTGGSSVGEADMVPAVISEVLGSPPLFRGLALRPGRPTAAWVAQGRLVVALPGHPVSALVVYELLLRDALRRLGGEAAPPPRPERSARLAAPLRAPADRELWARVQLEESGPDGEPLARALAGSSAELGALARADGLVACPAGAEWPAGARVSVLLLD